MSALLDSLCGPARLAEIAANEAPMHIVTHDTPGLQVVEVWHTSTRREERILAAREECGTWLPVKPDALPIAPSWAYDALSHALWQAVQEQRA